MFQKCPDKKSLEAYVQDALDCSAKTELEGHLKACSSCTKEYEQILRLNELLALPLTPSPSNFTEQILNAVKQAKKKQDLSWLTFALRSIIIGILLVIAFVIGIAMWGIASYGPNGAANYGWNYIFSKLQVLYIIYRNALAAGLELWAWLLNLPKMVITSLNSTSVYYFEHSTVIWIFTASAIVWAIFAGWLWLLRDFHGNEFKEV